MKICVLIDKVFCVLVDYGIHRRGVHWKWFQHDLTWMYGKTIYHMAGKFGRNKFGGLLHMALYKKFGGF